MDIDVRQLYRSFGSREVLRGVDLHIPKGGVHVIIGGSGTGKSVLLKHMIGLLRPNSGQILVDGTDITRLSERALYPIRQRMAYIFQGCALLNSLTVGQNIGLSLSEFTHEKPRTIRRIVEEKLELVGLKGRADDMPSNLSGGQKKRVAVARALASDPEVLLYDEPTAGLDPPTASNVDNVIREVARETGVTTVLVTHDMISVFEVATHVHMLHAGRVVFSGTPQALRDSGDPEVRLFLKRDCGGARLTMCTTGEFRAIAAERAADPEPEPPRTGAKRPRRQQEHAIPGETNQADQPVTRPPRTLPDGTPDPNATQPQLDLKKVLRSAPERVPDDESADVDLPPSKPARTLPDGSPDPNATQPQLNLREELRKGEDGGQQGKRPLPR